VNPAKYLPHNPKGRVPHIWPKVTVKVKGYVEDVMGKFKELQGA